MEEQTVKPLAPSPAARMMSFVRRHRVGLTAITSSTVTAIVLTKMRGAALEEMAEFIYDKGLMDEYLETHPIITK
jgi:hypothetical protein